MQPIDNHSDTAGIKVHPKNVTGFASMPPVSFLLPMLVRHDPERRPQWCAKDAACVKKLTENLSKTLPQSAACTHLRGNGGLKGTLRRVQRALGQHHYVFRTDVKSYYASTQSCMAPCSTALASGSSPSVSAQGFRNTSQQPSWGITQRGPPIS